MANYPSVCAVVVTYNRKELLVHCLDALLRQTVPLDRIYIINNASTDGTELFLEEEGYFSNPCIELVTLPSNLGGAGGFYHGIKTAFANNFEQILLMDDDGFPADDCLQQLLKYRGDNLCVGALVLDKSNPERLLFPMRLPNRSKVINEVHEFAKLGEEDLLADVIIPFNGVLLSRDLVARYGYPKPEYFIWGDDMEYIWRLRQQGARLATVLGAKFYHPRDLEIGTPMFFKQMRFNDTSSKLKLYCMSRNNTVNLLTYKGKFAFVAFVLKLVWFYLITAPNKQKLSIGLTGIKHGLQRDFTHHKEYLK